MSEHDRDYDDIADDIWAKLRPEPFSTPYMLVLKTHYEEMTAKAAVYDTARAEHAADCIRFAEILEREGFLMDGQVFRAKAAALATPADGSADADADAADGSER
jgi:hypothetical protein